MNEYTPWIELNQTEVEYWKARYLEERLRCEKYQKMVCWAHGREDFEVMEWEYDHPPESTKGY